MKRFQIPKYTIPLNGKFEKFSDKWLRELETADPKKYEAYDYLISEYQKNPLSFSLLHGAKNEEFGNDGLAVANDILHDLIVLLAPNQTGKSFLGAVYCALRLIKCDPDWPCFKQHGLNYIPWEGPKILIAASYTWDKTRDLWNTYRDLFPRNEIGRYARAWGIFPGEKGRAKEVAFRFDTKEIELECGSRIIFLCYKQSMAQWTGKQCDIAHLDEQCPEDYFDELTQRQLTRGDFTPIIMTLTGHVIPDRPDTGAAGWIKQKVVDGKVTKGRKVGQYHIDMESVPGAVMTPKAKEKARIQWVVEPQKYKDEKKMREAVARYFGGWEIGGGAVFGEVNRHFHMIEPFDLTPYHPTYYRMVDHGQNPCACALFAILPWGDCVLYKEYYEFGRNIESNVIGILGACGNSRQLIDSYEHMNMSWPVYQEIQNSTVFRASELDIRSFGTKALESGRTVGALYNQFGLLCGKSSGQHDDILFPLLKEWLVIRKDRDHIYKKIHRKVPEPIEGMGAPRMYFFNTCRNTIKEFEGYIDKKCPDHLISCCKFFCATDRPYLGDTISIDNFSSRGAKVQICEETGY